MPKPTHVYKNDAIVTDKKFRPEDDRIYAEEKREFQGSETDKADEADAVAEESSTGDTPAPGVGKADPE